MGIRWWNLCYLEWIIRLKTFKWLRILFDTTNFIVKKHLKWLLGLISREIKCRTCKNLVSFQSFFTRNFLDILFKLMLKFQTLWIIKNFCIIQLIISRLNSFDINSLQIVWSSKKNFCLIYWTLENTLNVNLIISFASHAESAECALGDNETHSLSAVHKMCPITCVCRLLLPRSKINTNFFSLNNFRLLSARGEAVFLVSW